jgi:hypothetical protein
MAENFPRSGPVIQFVGPDLYLRVCRQDIRRRTRRYLVNQRWLRWQVLGNSQREARELISGHCLGAKDRFLSFNRTQSRAVIGLLN